MEIVNVEKEESVDPLGNGSSPQTLKGAKTVPTALKIDDEANVRIIVLIRMIAIE